MVLVSPGVETQLINESFYLSAGSGTVPCFFIATHENKIGPSGSGVAEGTLKANANKLWLATGQRDLIQTFGNPVFYKNEGTPLHAYELNELGLHGAWQYLGIANRAYIVRADIDLTQLIPQTTSPRGNPGNGWYWLDTTTSRFGVFQSNGSVSPGLAWQNQTVKVVTKYDKFMNCLITNTTNAINDLTYPITAGGIIGGGIAQVTGALIINGTSISVDTHRDTLGSIIANINNAKIPNIQAYLEAKADIINQNGRWVPGIKFNIMLYNTIGGSFDIAGDSSVIAILGFNNSSTFITPDYSNTAKGDYALMALEPDNKILQRLVPSDCFGIPISNAALGPRWYLVGSPEWQAASPTVVSGTTVNGQLTGSVSFMDAQTPTPVSQTVAVGTSLNQFAINVNAVGSLRASGLIAVSLGSRMVFSNIYGKSIVTSGEDAGGSFTAMNINPNFEYKGNQLYFSTHASIPSNSVRGDVWVKTTEPNNGAKWAIKIYNATTGTWNVTSAPLYDSDTDASLGWGSQLFTGALYIEYNSEVAPSSSLVEATFELRRWTGTTWMSLKDYTIGTANVFVGYEAAITPPSSGPSAGTMWYNTDIKIDLMVSNGTVWSGYRNMYPNTDIIIKGSQPFEKPNGNGLIDKDIWIDTSDLENYPRIYKYDTALSQWQLIDNTDQTTPFGVLFADARQDNGHGKTTYEAMLGSDYVDVDVPDAYLYPDGMLMFNTRFSTFNVKVWNPKYTYQGSIIGDRWVTASGNKPDGSPYMGRHAQRQMIIQAMAASISSSEECRSDANYFNLLAAPGYVELMNELIVLNQDKKNVAFIVGDTPARLKANGIQIQNWATNKNLAESNGDVGLTTSNDYAGIYYPWGLSTNIDGSSVMIPPSSIALRTIAYSDSIGYPWLAPAGFRRGNVTNASTVGYLTSEEEYQSLVLNQGQRDVLYMNKINPVAYIPGQGLVIYGQKTLSSSSSAMDRINVARLMNYLNYQLDLLARPYLFQPNDAVTRDSVKYNFDRFLSGLVSLQAMYDFVVVCDGSNNTPARIDRNELWIDIAIQPMKAIEFIYIPVRLLNTQ